MPITEKSRPGSGEHSRSWQIDRSALRLKVFEAGFKSIEAFISKSTAGEPRTLKKLLDTGWGRPSVIEDIAKELEVADVRLLLVTERDLLPVTQHALHDYRRIALHVIHTLGPNLYDVGEGDQEHPKNIWDEVSHFPHPLLENLLLSDGQKDEVFQKLCRDGWLEFKGEKCYHIKYNDPEQLYWLNRYHIDQVVCFTAITLERIDADLTFAFRKEVEEGLEKSISEAKDHLIDGINFLNARRHFFETLGIELGSVGQSLVTLVDAVDQVYLQRRFLLKCKHGLLNEAYRDDIKRVNLIILGQLEEIATELSERNPCIDTLRKSIEEHGRYMVDVLMKERDLLRIELGRGGGQDGMLPS